MQEDTTYVGLDVHKSVIQIALIPPGSEDPLEWQTPNTQSKVRSLIRKLRVRGGDRVEICYESGPHGLRAVPTVERGAWLPLPGHRSVVDPAEAW